MHSLFTATVAAAILSSTAPAATEFPPAEYPQQIPTPVTVLNTTYVKPKKKLIVRSKFKPWATPTPAQVQQIIAIESARVGAPIGTLTNRIRCESGFRWNAGNGPYNGLGQFHETTFARGVNSLDTRRVVIRTERVRSKRVRRVEWLSDGTHRGSWAWPVRQKVVHINAGMIPRYPGYLHGWAQVRIMALALVGRSGVKDSEWECRG